MRPAPFDYHRAASLAEACDLLARVAPDGRVLAGGQSLIPAMSLRLSRPAAVVDIGRIAGLDRIAIEATEIRIGALVTHAAIAGSAELAEALPLLPVAARAIAHPAVRNRGTFGGSLANADPASEWPAALLALGGRVRAASKRGERWIDSGAFFQTYFTTALEPDEILVEVALPRADRGATRWAFREFARQPGAFATVLVIVGATLAADGKLAGLRVALGGCGPTPLAPSLDWSRFLGARPTPAAVDAAALALGQAIDPRGDIHASAEDRRQIAATLFRRALMEACGLAATTASQ